MRLDWRRSCGAESFEGLYLMTAVLALPRLMKPRPKSRSEGNAVHALRVGASPSMAVVSAFMTTTVGAMKM